MALPQSRQLFAFAPAVPILRVRNQRSQAQSPNRHWRTPRQFSANRVCTAVADSLWDVHKVSNSSIKSGTRSDNPCHAVVVGAGLAGLITALELVEQRFTVDVYEARPFAGGKVGSWIDRDGNHIEMGLHVFFGCYYNLFDVMARVGAFKHLLLKEHRHQFVNIGGRLAELDFRLGAVGAPWNGLKAFATTDQMGVVDRIRNAIALGSSVIVRGLVDLDGALEQIRALDNISFSEWFLSKGGTRASIERLWNPVAFALGFIDCDNISARCMLTLFQLFAARSEASVLRMLEGSPGEYLITPIVKYIEQRGAKLYLRRKVRALNYDDCDGQLRVTSLDIANGTETERVTGDAYIIACDVPGVQKLIPHEWRLRHKQLDRLFSLQAVPVVTVQLRFNGWVTELSEGTVESHATAVTNSNSTPGPARGIDNLLYTADAEFSCFADLAVTSPTDYYREGEGSLLQLVLTPGDPHIARSNEEIVERTLKQVRKLFPSAEKLVCTWSSVVKLAQSLYREEPGQDVNRPAQRTPVQNFFLAGSYTYQDYIDSMEGACKSGRLAAAAVLSALQERTPSS